MICKITGIGDNSCHYLIESCLCDIWWCRNGVFLSLAQTCMILVLDSVMGFGLLLAGGHELPHFLDKYKREKPLCSRCQWSISFFTVCRDNWFFGYINFDGTNYSYLYLNHTYTLSISCWFSFGPAALSTAACNYGYSLYSQPHENGEGVHYI